MASKSLVLAAAAFPLPSVAVAHPGAHEHAATLENLRHLLTQPDHLLAASALLLCLLTCGGLRLARVRVRVRR